MDINTIKYFKILKDNKILDYFDREKSRVYRDADYKALSEENILIGILMYLYIISNTKGELTKFTYTKIRHIKLLRDCTRWEGYDFIGLRAAKVIVEAFIDLNFIVDGRRESVNQTDITDIGICLRDELAECFNTNIDTLIAKHMLLGNISDSMKHIYNKGIKNGSVRMWGHSRNN